MKVRIEEPVPVPCPASTVEYNGVRTACILDLDHDDAHTDGCLSWFDEWGEVDAEQEDLEPE